MRVVVVGEGSIACYACYRLLQKGCTWFLRGGMVAKSGLCGCTGFWRAKSWEGQNPHYYYSKYVVVVTTKNGCANLAL